MAENNAYKVLDRTLVSANQVGRSIDLGAYNKLQICIRIHLPGAAGTIQLEHAPVDEPLAFRVLGSSVSLTSLLEAGGYQSITDYQRFVRYTSSGTVSGANNVSIDITAKTA